MEPQIEKFLNDYADKALAGPGFIAFAPKEKEEFKARMLDYFSDLIFETLLKNLNESQLNELQAYPDLGTEEAQGKIAQMSATIPEFIVILQEKFDQTVEEIGRTGRIPEITMNPATAPSL